MFAEERVRESTSFLLKKKVAPAVAGLSLEAGMDGFSGEMSDVTILRTTEIPHFPQPHVEGRRERILAGYLADRPAFVQEGRGYLFEGYFRRELAYPLRVFAAMGVGRLIFAVTVTPLGEETSEGHVVIVDDHLDLTGGSPLRGTSPAGRPAEPDPSLLHSPRLGERARTLAAKEGLGHRSGILALLAGPLAPTRAELKMLATVGADFFGFSPAAELAMARTLGIETLVVGLASRNCAAPTGGREGTWGERHLALFARLVAEAGALGDDGPRPGVDLGRGGP